MVILESADCTSYFVPCHVWFACQYQKLAVVWDRMDGICLVTVGFIYRADLDILSTAFVAMESREIHLCLQQRSKMCPISCHPKMPILLSSIRGTLGNQLRDWHPSWTYRWLSLMKLPLYFFEEEYWLHPLDSVHWHKDTDHNPALGWRRSQVNPKDILCLFLVIWVGSNLIEDWDRSQ